MNCEQMLINFDCGAGCRCGISGLKLPQGTAALDWVPGHAYVSPLSAPASTSYVCAAALQLLLYARGGASGSRSGSVAHDDLRVRWLSRLRGILVSDHLEPELLVVVDFLVGCRVQVNFLEPLRLGMRLDVANPL